MPPYYYYWQEDAPQGEYAILRLYSEGQIHLEDHIEMLSAINGAYLPWCQLHLWSQTALREDPFEGPFPFESRRFRHIERLLRKRFRSELDPYYDELVAMLLLGAPRMARSLNEAISSLVVDPQNRPILHRCQLASPGSVDIAGVGKVFEVLKDWITGRGLRKAQERETNARAHKTEAEAKAQELQNLQNELRLAIDFRNTARELGYSPSEIQGILAGDMTQALRALNPIIDRGQIQGAEIIPFDGDM